VRSLQVAGVDEAGRGPLAGPVFAAAVILDPRRPIQGLGDSKQLTARARARLALQIRAGALAWSVAWADSEEIDALNILQATHLAMRRALLGLRMRPDHVQIDGNRLPAIGDLCDSAEAIVKGDCTVAAISAASILAKTGRDARMEALDAVYPGYRLTEHKGYPTPVHLAALRARGVSRLHRRSFAPVREIAEEQKSF
jgi:ribonuclease HII